MLLLALAVAPASAYDSDPAELLFADEFDVFAGVEYDTGPLPAGSPVAFRFHIESKGGTYAELEGESTLSWPDALTHGVHGYPGGGWLALVTDIDVKLDLVIDLGSAYTGTVGVWSNGLDLSAATVFDGLLLPKPGGVAQMVELVSTGKGIDTITLPFSIVSGVNVTVTLDLFPQAWANLTGRRVETQVIGEAGLSTLDEEGAFRFVDVPSENPGLVDMTSTWFGALDASLDLVLVPGAQVCVIGYCFDVLSFSIPISLAGVSEERALGPVDYLHPLPSISVPMAHHDFGDVEVGNLINLEVPIENVGLLGLEGFASIQGSENITVFPQYFYASAGNTDGVMLTFAPEAVNDLAAVLVIESNDPVRPRIEIPLLGHGFVEADPDDPDNGRGDSVSIRTCGCDASPAPGLAGAWALLVGLLAIRRRRA